MLKKFFAMFTRMEQPGVEDALAKERAKQAQQAAQERMRHDMEARAQQQEGQKEEEIEISTEDIEEKDGKAA